MKTIRIIQRMAAAGLGALLLLAACDHKELCYQHPHTSSLHVVFDWREAPDADPESMYVWFFPEEGGEPVQYHLAGKAGGAVSLAEGRYGWTDSRSAQPQVRCWPPWAAAATMCRGPKARRIRPCCCRPTWSTAHACAE